MAALSVATGLTLLYDEGVLPPNPERQALAFATPAEYTQLASEGLALKTTATALAMEDEAADGTAEVSPAAMQFLVQNLASPITPASNSEATQPIAQSSGYPYGGWSDDSSPAAVSASFGTAPINVLA